MGSGSKPIKNLSTITNPTSNREQDSVRDALLDCKEEIRDLREIVLFSKRSKWERRI